MIVLERGESMGLDRQTVMRRAKLSWTDLEDPDARVPESVVWKVWREVIHGLPDIPVGIRMGAETSVREFGLVGYSMLHSADLQQALRRLMRYGRIISEGIRYTLRVEESHVEVQIKGSPQLDALRHPIDARVAALMRTIREITQTEVAPVETWFPYPRPDDTSEHERLFRCPLIFGESESKIVLRKPDLALPVTQADDTLSGYLDRLASDMLQSLADRGSLVDRMRRAIWMELSGGRPTIERISSVLGVSARTLQRRLAQKGTSFADELERMRREMAARLLADRNLAVTEVAFLLGYSEPSTFYRAFRRWKGVTPLEFRRAVTI